MFLSDREKNNDRKNLLKIFTSAEISENREEFKWCLKSSDMISTKSKRKNVKLT